uniref:Choline/ethanolamine kinase n=1 Tax=Panagrolaimus davidi TaxID=227884 RepID=A0A914PRV1_9BILA
MCENKNIFKDLFDPAKANNIEMDPAVKKTILKYCGDFLGGIWKEVNPEKIDIEKLDGGTLNIIFLCSLKDSIHPLNNEPKKVVFRIYCKPDSGIISETVICSILAEKNLGPKLYGIFDGGRIEEYIPSKPLTMEDICVPSISKEISKQFAQIHQLCVPIKKSANFMEFIDEWFQNLSNNQNLPPFFDIPEHYHNYSPKTLTIQDLKTELEFIRSKLSKLLKNIVFCHNDLHGGNILLINDNKKKHEGYSKNLNQQVSSPKLMLIDFEFSSYNPRGFDLGNHFAEYVFDYEAKTPPYSSTTRIPSEKHMFEFIFAYIDFQNPELSKDEKNQKAEILLKEILPFIPISYLFWSGYMINDGLNSKTDFDFIGFALERLGLYFMHKHYLKDL